MGIKLKLFLGYFILIIIAGFTTWLVLNELLRPENKQLELNPINKKVLHINDILANLYHAEGLERNLINTGEETYYIQYEKLLDTIRLQVDSLTTLIDLPIQKQHADSIQTLLDKKQQNLQDLIYLKNNYSLNALYQEALTELDGQKDSLVQYYEINQRQTTVYDTTYIRQKKTPFIKRFFKAFADNETNDSTMQVKISASIETDSLATNLNPSDSISALLSQIKQELELKSDRAERQIKLMEREILSSDRAITQELKKILTLVENEELLKSLEAVTAQRDHNAKISRIILILGIVSFFTILFFGFNILKDISKSQHYRQNLEVAKTETEKVLKSKEQFMLSLTHDLKSPLNAIIGFTRLIENEKLNFTVNRYLKNIDQSSRHIKELVNQLLDLAKLQQGKLKINAVPLNLHNLVEQLAENYRMGAIQKQVQFKLENALHQEKHYYGDPVRITQILVNLLSNAIKFTQKGFIELSVSSSPSGNNTENITIEVIDTGIGIDAEDLPNIFEEFTRGKADKSRYEGTGLGLAITYKLVKLLDGHIHLESKTGEGSHFTVTLPMQLTEEKAEEYLPDSILAAPQHNFDALRGLTIFLVDDDKQMLEMLTAVLKGEGMKVRAFIDPASALKNFEKNSADLLVTDLQMPNMEGNELLEQIKIKTGSTPPAILMSGRDEEPETEIKSGFMAFIKKPFEPIQILNTIFQHLDQVKEATPKPTENNTGQKSYNLDQIKQFLGEDTPELKEFLKTYLNTSLEHLALLENHKAKHEIQPIAELAHKMLNILRQLNANKIIEIYAALESQSSDQISMEAYLELTQQGISKMKDLIKEISHNEGISSS